MRLPLIYLKYYQQLKLRLEQLTERDRISLLVIVLSLLCGLWFLALYYPQKNAISADTNQIKQIEIKISEVKQKQSVIHMMLSNPDTAKFLDTYKDLIAQMNKIDEQFARYRQRYISSRDLAKLLHDMLKQTFGVTIVDFSTIPQSAPVQTSETTNQTASGEAKSQDDVSDKMNIVHTHYRLVLKGQYFPIMNYLKRLESLAWNLYWDKFDYSVKKYPIGNAVIEFYTLKLPPDQDQVQQRGSP